MKSRLGKRQTPPALTASPRLPTSPSATVFEDDDWLGIFQAMHRLLSYLYRDKTHIEIWHFLAYVEMNLIVAGYGGSGEEIVTRFRTIFPQLGFQAVKGRDARKFVYVQDTFGRQEPFALLKLECEDG